MTRTQRTLWGLVLGLVVGYLLALALGWEPALLYAVVVGLVAALVAWYPVRLGP